MTCGRSSNPCYHLHPAHPTAAGTAPSPSATAWPRWCSWPAPPPLGPPACQGARLRLGLHRLAPAGPVGQGRRVRQTRGDHVGANPVDRGKPGSKLHLVSERGGLPLTAAVTAANVNEGVRDAPCARTLTGTRP